MKKSDEELIKSYKRLVYCSIISADNDRYSEEIKQEVLSRYNKEADINNQDWEYVLEPLGSDAKRFINLLKQV